MSRRLKKYIGLPLILIGSDLLIMFIGHFSGKTGGDFTISAFVDYISTITLEELLPPIVIAIIVLLYVEHLDRSGRK